MELSRRQFIQAAAVGAAAVPALDAAPKLPTRTLGKTGIKVSILGFGSGCLSGEGGRSRPPSSGGSIPDGSHFLA
jgi:hypothetical protein